MKVVLMHDWLTGFRGGERVLEAFCELFPEAPLYTLIYQKGSTNHLIEERKIHTSWLDKVPGIAKNYRKFLPLFPMAADSLKIKEKADIILSSSHCVIKGVKHSHTSKHISYIHSPMRYIYDQFDVYFGPNAPRLHQWGAKICRPYLLRWDIHSNQNVDVMVANSHFVAHRIKHYYARNAGVIHPFVDLKDFKFIQSSPPQKEDYYVMVTAFAPNKRVDLAVKACLLLGRKLKIVGSGQEENRLKALAQGSSNIEFLGQRSRDEIIELLAKAKAFLFPGIEDFGITPLESLASGTPVIAYKAGGVLETLNENVAQFFTHPDVDSLKMSILEFEKLGSDYYQREKLFARANDFSKEKFKLKIGNLIERVSRGEKQLFD